MQFLYFLSIYYKKDKWCISLYDFVSFSVSHYLICTINVSLWQEGESVRDSPSFKLRKGEG